MKKLYPLLPFLNQKNWKRLFKIKNNVCQPNVYQTLSSLQVWHTRGPLGHIQRKNRPMIHIVKEYLRFSWNVVVAVLLTFFFIGINFNRLLLPESVFILITGLLMLYGLASFISLLYWTSFKWSELKNNGKLKEVVKIAVLVLLLAAQISLISKVLLIYLGS